MVSSQRKKHSKIDTKCLFAFFLHNKTKFTMDPRIYFLIEAVGDITKKY